MGKKSKRTKGRRQKRARTNKQAMKTLRKLLVSHYSDKNDDEAIAVVMDPDSKYEDLLVVANQEGIHIPKSLGRTSIRHEDMKSSSSGKHVLDMVRRQKERLKEKQRREAEKQTKTKPKAFSEEDEDRDMKPSGVKWSYGASKKKKNKHRKKTRKHKKKK